MGEEKRDSDPGNLAEGRPSSPPRISRPVFTPPRPESGGSSPAPRPTVPPLTTPLPPGASPLPPSVRPPPPPSERARPAKDPAWLELEAKHARTLHELNEARAALMKAQHERARFEQALAARQVEAERAEQRIAELERKLTAHKELEERVDELEAQSLEVVSLRQQNSELEARLGAAQASSAAPPAADDLRRLRGVGPAFERGLKALGITTFAQIADFTEADIERVAKGLKLSPERIRRDDWVGSARAFLAAPEKG